MLADLEPEFYVTPVKFSLIPAPPDKALPSGRDITEIENYRARFWGEHLGSAFKT